MASNDSVFEIGLAMAGAISAGAYSAGVVDFLFHALDEWERLKREAPETVPNHSVCIRAAAGASAGSITAALAVVAVAGGLRREEFAAPAPGKQRYKCVLPALYTAWVMMPDMASPKGDPDLLSNNDLQAGKPPRSILNAQILEDLTDVALKLPASPAGPPSAPAYGGRGLAYFAERLHLYLTLSNLRGVPYRIDFATGGNVTGHYMMSHGDRAHYVLEDIGVHAGENQWLKQDPAISLKIATAPQGDGVVTPDWQAYGRTALASAAFPIGLAARPIMSKTALYKNRSWPGLPTTGTRFEPNWPAGWDDTLPFDFMSVDGGLIDNQPFEISRRAIMPDDSDSNERSEELVSGAVLMVDPFPEPPSYSTEEVLEASILQVARSLFPMLKNQARFKPDELAAALDNACYSRWMIAPSRPMSGDDKKDERYAIATGLLGGFGGFFDEVFRAHDYQLGRRNCQRFLKEIFSVREDNPLVYDEASKALKSPAYNDPRFRKHDSLSNKFYCPVIPVVGDAEPEVPAPLWPRIGSSRLAQINQRIAARVDYIVPALLTDKTLGPLKSWLLRQAWRWLGKKSVMKYVRASIASDLIRRDQMAEWSSVSAHARAVLAELTAPGYDYRTVGGGRGICRATLLGDAEVRGALSELQARKPGLLWSGQVEGQECWALEERRPGWFDRNNPLGGEPSIG